MNGCLFQNGQLRTIVYSLKWTSIKVDGLQSKRPTVNQRERYHDLKLSTSVVMNLVYIHRTVQCLSFEPFTSILHDRPLWKTLQFSTFTRLFSSFDEVNHLIHNNRYWPVTVPYQGPYRTGVFWYQVSSVITLTSKYLLQIFPPLYFWIWKWDTGSIRSAVNFKLLIFTV